MSSLVALGDSLVSISDNGDTPRRTSSADRCDSVREPASVHGVAHESGGGSQRKLYVKGAAEVVLSKSVAMLDALGHKVPLDALTVHRQLESLATKGLRVLVLASADLSVDKQSIKPADVNELTLLGLQGMIDPPRSEAISAVRACQSAGIHVKMITGDHALTAQAIARQIGLNGMDSARPDSPLVLTGRDLAGLSDSQLIDTADQVAVFARVTPEQKLRLVRALQANGHIVAMTGTV